MSLLDTSETAIEHVPVEVGLKLTVYEPSSLSTILARTVIARPTKRMATANVSPPVSKAMPLSENALIVKLAVCPSAALVSPSPLSLQCAAEAGERSSAEPTTSLTIRGSTEWKEPSTW